MRKRVKTPFQNIRNPFGHLFDRAIANLPLLTIPGPKSINIADVPLVFTAGQISFGDALETSLTVTLSVGAGTITLATLAGLTVLAGANASGSIKVSGTITALNTAVTDLSYTHNSASTQTLSILVENSTASTAGTVDIEILASTDILSGLVATRITTTTAGLALNVAAIAGTVAFVAVANGSGQPTALQISQGKNAAGSAAIWAGTATASTVDIYANGVTGLTAGTDYDVYAVYIASGPTYSNIVTADLSGDLSAPTINTLSPANNATGIAQDAPLVLVFNENVQFGVTGTIELWKNDSGWALVESFDVVLDVGTSLGQINISGATLTIYKSANFVGGKQYSIHISSTAIKDLVGNAFSGIADDTTWNFTATAGYNRSIVAQYGQSLKIGTSPSENANLKSVETAKNITNVTWDGTKIVVTSAGHGYADGEEGFILSVGGATQVNQRSFTLGDITTNTFSLKYFDGTYVDGTSLGAYTSGGTVARTRRSAKHFMFNGGIRFHYEQNTASFNVNNYTRQFTQCTSLVALGERSPTLSNADLGETGTYGAGLRITRPTVFFSAARGASAIDSLLSDTTAGIIHWENLMSGLRNAKLLNDAAGMTTDPVVILDFDQMESDGATAAATWKTKAQQIGTDFVKHGRHAFGSAITAKILLKQVALQSTLNNLCDHAVSAIQLHREVANFYCVGPTYQNDYEANNDFHLTQTWYRQWGEAIVGAAIESLQQTGDWDPCYIMEPPVRSGTSLPVKIWVPIGNLVIDTTAVASIANSGFVYSGSGGISSVSVGPTVDHVCWVTLTLANNVGGDLSYAYKNGVNDRVGHPASSSTGARGNIRDSANYTSTLDGTTHHNWLCVDKFTGII